MSVEEKLTTLNEVSNLREDVAFHFTSKENVDSILLEGLRPTIGDNASGGLGQSAIEKTYVSYGLEGVLRLYNRLVTLSFQANLDNLNNITHKPFIPDSAIDRGSNEHLSMIEGFEFIRQYMEDNVYFICDASKTQYEHNISDSELQDINQSIEQLEENGVNIAKRHKELNDKIEDLAKKPEQNKDEILKLVAERNRLAILVREKTLQTINSKRGKCLNLEENPIMEEVDYNDERLLWTNQVKKPHNTHTRIIEKDGKLQGVRIENTMLKIFSQDNKTVGNGLEFLNFMLKQVRQSDQVYIDTSEPPVCHDCNLLNKFQEYIQMVEKYKTMGLLETKPETTYEIGDKKRTLPERQIVDLSDIKKYPGIPEFSEELEQYYENNRYRKPGLDDCMQDCTARTSIAQKATRVVKEEVLGKDRAIDENAQQK